MYKYNKENKSIILKLLFKLSKNCEKNVNQNIKTKAKTQYLINFDLDWKNSLLKI